MTEKVVVHNLKKSFHHLDVLKGIDLTVAEGEVVCVIGPSGGGKSTFLRCLNRLEDATEGQIFVDGYEITDKKVNINKVRQNIGMVFQSFNLFAHLSVKKNIMLAPVDLKLMRKEEAEKKAMELLDRVGLADKANAFPHQLSGGQQQRVAIARALNMHPKIMLLDEPTSALDPEMVQEVLDVIKSLAETSMTIVMVTHEMGLAREAADTVVFMENGLIVDQGTPHYLFDETDNARVKSFLSKIL